MFFKFVVIVVLTVVFYPPLYTIWDMDWNRHFYKHYPGKCRLIETSGIGSEDLQIMSSGLTFITSNMYVTVSSRAYKDYVRSRGPGVIHLIDLNTPDSPATPLKINHGDEFNPKSFHPHGLSILEDKVKGRHLIYVINHVDGDEDRIEKLQYSPETKQLNHLKSIFGHGHLHLTNDLTLLSEDKFYISNNFYFNTSDVLVNLEQLYRLRYGSVIYFDGTAMTKVIDGIFSPNGVLLSKDNRYLYVSLANIRIVQVYKIKDKGGYKLDLVQEFNVHTFLDNFHLSEKGEYLLAGCHPILYKGVQHFEDPKNRAPSQVLRLPLKNGLIVENKITEEFYDHGDLITASSVAGIYKNKMIIGSVVDTLVVCKLPSTQ